MPFSPSLAIERLQGVLERLVQRHAPSRRFRLEGCFGTDPGRGVVCEAIEAFLVPTRDTRVPVSERLGARQQVQSDFGPVADQADLRDAYQAVRQPRSMAERVEQLSRRPVQLDGP